MIDLASRPVLIVVGSTAHVGARVGRGPLLLSEACNLQLSETRSREELELKETTLRQLDALTPCERCGTPALET